MKRGMLTFGYLLLMAGCGATVPKPIELPGSTAAATEKPAPAEPATVAVLPFENKSGNPDLNRLSTVFSAALSIRLKERQGWTYVPETRIRKAMADAQLAPSDTLDPKIAVRLSGVLYAETLITGAFEGAEDSLSVTASHVSGETGNLLRRVTVTSRYKNRSALIQQLITELTRARPAAAMVLFTRERMSRERAARVPAPVTIKTSEDIEQVLRLYWQTIDANPNFAEARFVLGYAYDKKGEMDKALASYRQATALDSLNADYWYVLGYTYERKQEWPAAIDAYERALALKPDDAGIIFATGYVYEKQGRLKNAIEMYTRGIELKPNDYDAYYGLAAAYESSGRLEEAFDMYRQVVAGRPGETPAVRELAQIAEKLGKWNAAAEAYRALLKIQPGDARAHLELAQIYRRQGEVNEAITEYHNVIRLNPGVSYAYTGLGNLYVRQKQYDKALEQYQAALKVNPDVAALYYNIGNVYGAQGKYREAVEAYTRYLDIMPDGEYASKIKIKLGELKVKALSQE